MNTSRLAWRCRLRAIERGEVRGNRSLVVTETAVVTLLAVLMIVYMLLTAKSLVTVATQRFPEKFMGELLY